MSSSEEKFADDLLNGAEEIAIFLFGAAKYKRRVYHLCEKGELPIFRLGAGINARRSVLREFIRLREAQAMAKGTAN